jgi:hypothetical protein
MYRALIRDEQDSPNDALFDSLTRRVVEFMHQKDISEWDNNLWGTYRAMLAQHQKQPLMQGKSVTEEMESMSEEELKALTSSTNSADG